MKWFKKRGEEKKKRKKFPKGYRRDISKDEVVYLKDDTDERTFLLQKNRKKAEEYRNKKRYVSK